MPIYAESGNVHMYNVYNFSYAKEKIGSDNYKDLTSHSLQGNTNTRTSPIVIHVLIGLQAPTVVSWIVKVYRVTYASMVEPYL